MTITLLACNGPKMTTDKVEIRPADPEDLMELHALIESAYRGETAKAGWTHEADLLEGPRTNIETLKAIVDDSNEVLLKAVESGKIIGCVQLTRVSPSVAYLGLLTVSPRRQAGGLGKIIMEGAARAARQLFGSKVLQLAVVSQRSELIAYYERRGFALTGETRPFPVVCDPPLSLLVLEKALSS